MFSTKERLKKRTPDGQLNREEFIAQLANEYYTTTDIEAQEQVTANLANFAYDPLNFNYLKKAGAFNLFLELIQSPNHRLVLHGSAGICNICLDPDFNTHILIPENLNKITILLHHPSADVILNALTTLLLITCDTTKSLICTRTLIQKVGQLKLCADDRVMKAATLFYRDYCTRTETNTTS